MNLRRRIQEIIGFAYRHALFYNFPGGLRFELSEGSSPLDQALSALRKASIVCDDVFSGEERILVHLEVWAPTSRFGLRAMLRELNVAGVPVPKVRDVWFDMEDEEGDEDFRLLCCAFEIPRGKLQNIIWCAITTDLGSLRPKPRCRVYLLNLSKSLVIHPYDDRGMDVIGENKSALSELYKRHSEFLLSYDIERMRKTFEES